MSLSLSLSLSVCLLQSSLQCTPWGLLASVEQQVSDLRVNQAESKPAESPAEPVDSPLSAGE